MKGIYVKPDSYIFNTLNNTSTWEWGDYPSIEPFVIDAAKKLLDGLHNYDEIGIESYYMSLGADKYAQWVKDIHGVELRGNDTENLEMDLFFTSTSSEAASQHLNGEIRTFWLTMPIGDMDIPSGVDKKEFEAKVKGKMKAIVDNELTNNLSRIVSEVSLEVALEKSK